MKDFDQWNEKKKKIHDRNDLILFHEREIWWCALGVNIGFEQDGKNENFERPVLILSKFNREVLWAVPLTRRQKNNKYYFNINHQATDSWVILSQVKLISSRRLLRRTGALSEDKFKEVVNKIKGLFPIV